MHNYTSSAFCQELAPEVAARIAEAERIAAEAEAEAAAFAEQAAAVQAEHDLKRQEQLQASLPTLAAACLHTACLRMSTPLWEGKAQGADWPAD